MIYRGRIKGGMIVLDDPEAKIPEGTPVSVETLPAQTEADLLDDPFYRIDELAIETGIPDLSTNIDHYLYGHPKVDDDAS
jgi:hypothetical protein